MASQVAMIGTWAVKLLSQSVGLLSQPVYAVGTS